MPPDLTESKEGTRIMVVSGNGIADEFLAWGRSVGECGGEMCAAAMACEVGTLVV